LWRVRNIQRARVRNVETAERDSVLAIDGAGDVAEGQVMSLDLAERASVSLDAHDPAGMPMRSSRRMTNRTTDQTIGRRRLDREGHL
jgi:hypothetical protein